MCTGSCRLFGAKIAHKLLEIIWTSTGISEHSKVYSPLNSSDPLLRVRLHIKKESRFYRSVMSPFLQPHFSLGFALSHRCTCSWLGHCFIAHCGMHAEYKPSWVEIGNPVVVLGYSDVETRITRRQYKKFSFKLLAYYSLWIFNSENDPYFPLCPIQSDFFFIAFRMVLLKGNKERQYHRVVHITPSFIVVWHWEWTFGIFESSIKAEPAF